MRLPTKSQLEALSRLMRALFVTLFYFVAFNYIQSLSTHTFVHNMCSNILHSSMKQPKVPEAITLAYCNWNQADIQVIDAVRNGVNVLVWFSVNVAKNEDGICFVQGGPDIKEVASLMKQMREEGLVNVVHLMSIGGWNSPHLDTSFTAQTMFDTLDSWNREMAILGGSTVRVESAYLTDLIGILRVTTIITVLIILLQ